MAGTLSASRGVGGTPVSALVEQSFPGGVSGEKPVISNPYYIPYNLENNSAISGVAAVNEKNYVDDYLEIVPEAGETYDAFRMRVAARPLQYGYYVDAAGVTFVINYGRLGADTSFASANEWAGAAADAATGMGYYSEVDRQSIINYYTASFGNNSVVKQLPVPVLSACVHYPVTLEDSKMTTTAKVTYDGVEKTLTGNATLTGAKGTTAVGSSAVMLYNVDAETEAMLPGGAFKLQIKGSDGTYEDYLANDGGEMIREGGNDGTLSFAKLGVGTYRVVGITSPDRYDMETSDGYDAEAKVMYSADFTITGGEGEGATVVMRYTKKITPSEDDTPADVPDDGGINDEDGGSSDEVQEGEKILVPDTGGKKNNSGPEIDYIGMGLGGVAFAIMTVVYIKKTGKRRIEY